MKQTVSVVFLLVLFSFLDIKIYCQDYRYQVTSMYDSTDQGQILQQNPYSGWVLFSQDGTYKLQLHIYDEGTYRFVKANANQANDVIYFSSKQKYQFFAYLRVNSLEVWISKTKEGKNRWVHAELTTGLPATSQQGTGSASGTNETKPAPGTKKIQISSLIKNGVFTKKVVYGNTSMPIYHYYNRATGEISADEKGIILRPNGTYFLRSKYGYSVIEGKGTYKIIGNQVQIVFSDKSDMTLTLTEGGKSLRWYSQGMLISEYMFLGVIE